MSYYEQQFLKDINDKRERKINGEYNGIPFCFPNYQNYVQSIDKGIYYCLASGPGNGKSFWMRYAFIYEPLKFALQTGYKIKILLFALEDSKSQIYKNICAHYLWERHGIYISKKILDSKIEPLPEKYLKFLQKDIEFYKIFEDMVYIIDDISEPDEMLAACEKCYNKFGEEYHYIGIVDNYANISQGSYKSKYEAVDTFSSQHVRMNLCKKLNFSFLAIVQNDMESEKNAGRYNGGNISSVEPTLGSFGDIKIISRSMHVIWALFNPWRYGILTYPNTKGYNIDLLRNKFRSLLMLKNNLDEMAPRLGLYFDGSKGTFEELPAVNDEEALRKIYDKVLQEEQKIRENRLK
jgi:hypothetical protein